MKSKTLLISLLAIMMVLLVPFSVGACGNKKTNTPPVKETEKEHFLLGSWVSYYDTHTDDCTSMRKQTEALAKAGINFLTVGNWIIDKNEPVKRDMTSLEWWKHVDDIMVENGIYYNFSQSFDDNTGNEVVNATGELSRSGVNNAKKIVPHLKNCIGFMLKDEPTYEAMDNIGNWGYQYIEAIPDKKIYVNMNPGTIITAYGDKNNPDLFGIKGPAGYKEFLQHWVDCGGAQNLEYLSHDFYPFNAGTNTWMHYFNDLEDMRYIGLKNNVKTHAFLQSNNFSGKRMPNIHEFRWNANTYLAYGFKALTHFNWVMWPGATDGLIDMDGNIPHKDLYDAVVEMNWEIRSMEDIILNLDCLHAYHTKNHISFESVELLPQNWVLQPTDNSIDVIVSHMQTKDTQTPYLVITNKSFTEPQITTFHVDPAYGIETLARYNVETGEYEEITVTDNSFSLTLDISEAAWIKVDGANVVFPE